MSLQVETTEALCSALYQMPFSEFMGEQDVNGDHLAWFHLGDRPKDIRVCIIRTQPGKSEEVRVHIEWRNYHADPRNPLKGEQTIHILTYDATQTTVKQNTEAAVLRILEVFQEVLAEQGVAGDISKLAPVSGNDED